MKIKKTRNYLQQLQESFISLINGLPTRTLLVVKVYQLDINAGYARGYYPRREPHYTRCLYRKNQFSRFIAFDVALIFPEHIIYTSDWQSEKNKIIALTSINVRIYIVYRDTISHVTFRFPDFRTIFELSAMSRRGNARRLAYHNKTRKRNPA